jgi:hypothetical protein
MSKTAETKVTYFAREELSVNRGANGLQGSITSLTSWLVMRLELTDCDLCSGGNAPSRRRIQIPTAEHAVCAVKIAFASSRMCESLPCVDVFASVHKHIRS